MIARAIAVAAAAVWVVAAMWGTAAPARADGWCNTSVVSGITYTTCRGYDTFGQWYSSTSTCFRSGYCTISEHR